MNSSDSATAPSNHAPIVLATGGTGGHVFPAQALAQELLARNRRVSFLIDRRAAQYAGQFPSKSSWEIIPAATYTQGSALKRLLAPLLMIFCVFSVMIKFMRDRPLAVIGFGSYASLPPMLGALIFNVPSVIHEQNGTMGKVNRLLASRVSRVASGPASPSFPDNTRWERTGNPIRQEVLECIPARYSLGSADIVKLLIVGGSQGARIFDEIIPSSLAMLPSNVRARIRVTQQVKPAHLARVEETYEALIIDSNLKAFFEDLPIQMARSHLIVARAGASSVAEITAMGLPSILIPFAAAANDHQTSNARELEDAAAAVVIAEKHFTAEVFAATLTELLEDPERMKRMAKASKALSVPDASKRLANLVEAII